jgi:hypothetical protein
LPLRPPGDEEPAAIFLHAHRDTACLRLDEECALSGAQAPAVDRPGRERPGEEALPCRRDPFGLEAVGKVDPLREGRIRGRARRRGENRGDRRDEREKLRHLEFPLRQ